MTPRRTTVEYLMDIQGAAEKAVTFLGSLSQDEFTADEKTVFAVVRALEIIGEATRKIPTEVKQRFPQVPWRSMSGIRDKLIHDYFTADAEIIWKTVKDDLPPATRANCRRHPGN